MKVLAFTGLLPQIPLKKLIVSKNKELLKKYTSDRIHLFGSGVLNWNTPRIYSFYITANTFYYQETMSRNTQFSSFEIGDIENYELLEGELSQVLGIRFLKMRFSFNNKPEFQFNIIPAAPNFERHKKILKNGLARIFWKENDNKGKSWVVRSNKSPLEKKLTGDKRDLLIEKLKHKNAETIEAEVIDQSSNNDQKAIDERFDALEEMMKTHFDQSQAVDTSEEIGEVKQELTPGAILLWDYDNIKFNANDNAKNNRMIEFIKNDIIGEYGPLIKGVAISQKSYSDETLIMLEKINAKIDKGRAIPQKDETDIKLLEKGLMWLEEIKPEYLIIISGDHIFTKLSEKSRELGTKIVLIHNQASNDWMGVATEFIPYILNNEIREVTQTMEFACPICGNVFKTENSVDQHMKAKHPAVYPCPECNRTFGQQNSMLQHFGMKHN